MPVQNFVRLRLSGRPDRDVCIRTSCYDAPVLEISHRIHCAIMEAKDLLRSIAG